MENPERFLELTWEGIKNKYMYRANNPKDEATAKQYASEDLLMQITVLPPYIICGRLKVKSDRSCYWKNEGRCNPQIYSGEMGRLYFPYRRKVEANVKISGGSDKLSHYTSFGYLKDEGYYIGSDFERFNARSNLSQDITSWLKSNVNMAYSYMELNKPGQGDNMNNGFQFINFMPSIFPVFQRDADGNK